MLVIDPFIFSISSWFSVGMPDWNAFLRMCPFLPRCAFYWHAVALTILCISVMSVVTSPFSFLILWISVLSPFFSWWESYRLHVRRFNSPLLFLSAFSLSLVSSSGGCSVVKSCLTLQPHRLQDARLLCPSLSPEVYSNSCPLSQWCYLSISSSASG